MTPDFRMLILAVAFGCVAQPGAAQERAQACLGEVDRLSSAIMAPGEGGTSVQDPASAPIDEPIEQEPGARKGAQLSAADRNRIQDIVRQARSAAEAGDADRCVQELAQARALLRQAGIGSAQPGSPTGIQAESAQGGSTIGGGAAGTTGPAAGMGAGGTTGATGGAGGGGLGGGGLGGGGIGGGSGGSGGGQ